MHCFETKQKYSPSGVNNLFSQSFLRSPFKCEKSEYLIENDKDEHLNDMDKLDGIKSLLPISLSQSNDYLESALSPKSVESQTSCRSHDGVFLRPDAISTQNSPSSVSTTPTMSALLTNRLTKRTSIDSGINVDLSIPSFRSSIWSRNKNQQREFQLMNSSNSITTAASLVTAASAAGIDTSNDTFSLCEYKKFTIHFNRDSHFFFSNLFLKKNVIGTLNLDTIFTCFTFSNYYFFF